MPRTQRPLVALATILVFTLTHVMPVWAQDPCRPNRNDPARDLTQTLAAVQGKQGPSPAATSAPGGDPCDENNPAYQQAQRNKRAIFDAMRREALRAMLGNLVELDSMSNRPIGASLPGPNLGLGPDLRNARQQIRNERQSRRTPMGQQQFQQRRRAFVGRLVDAAHELVPLESRNRGLIGQSQDLNQALIDSIYDQNRLLKEKQDDGWFTSTLTGRLQQRLIDEFERAGNRPESINLTGLMPGYSYADYYNKMQIAQQNAEMIRWQRERIRKQYQQATGHDPEEWEYRVQAPPGQDWSPRGIQNQEREAQSWRDRINRTNSAWQSFYPTVRDRVINDFNNGDIDDYLGRMADNIRKQMRDIAGWDYDDFDDLFEMANLRDLAKRNNPGLADDIDAMAAYNACHSSGWGKTLFYILGTAVVIGATIIGGPVGLAVGGAMGLGMAGVGAADTIAAYNRFSRYEQAFRTGLGDGLTNNAQVRGALGEFQTALLFTIADLGFAGFDLANLGRGLRGALGRVAENLTGRARVVRALEELSHSPDLSAAERSVVHDALARMEREARQSAADYLEQIGRATESNIDNVASMNRGALGNSDVIIDTNSAIALERRATGAATNSAHDTVLARLDELGLKPHVTDGVVTELGPYARELDGIVLTTSRDSAEYQRVLTVLNENNVGRAKGAMDRSIVADVFFAQTHNGAPPVFATADGGIYKQLARIAGHDPRTLGRSVPEAFPHGFNVTIDGRTIKVIPLPTS